MKKKLLVLPIVLFSSFLGACEYRTEFIPLKEIFNIDKQGHYGYYYYDYYSDHYEYRDYKNDVLNILKTYTSDAEYVKRIKKAYFLSKQQSEPINNLVGWLIKAIEEDWAQNSVKTVRGLGYSQIADYTNEVIVDAVEVPPKKKPKTRTTKKNSFNDFEQRDYDYDDLEKQLLKAGQS